MAACACKKPPTFDAEKIFFVRRQLGDLGLASRKLADFLPSSSAHVALLDNIADHLAASVVDAFAPT